MTEKDIIEKLTQYKSGGNYFLLYKIIVLNSTKNVCSLSQSELGQLVQKTRQFVSEALKVLEKHKLIEFKYKEIIILNGKLLTNEKNNTRIGED